MDTSSPTVKNKQTIIFNEKLKRIIFFRFGLYLMIEI